MAVVQTRRAARDRLRDPVFWSEVTQLVKTVLAGVVAWVIVSEVLDLPQSFLAPWAALLVVHTTVYRTFAQGARQVGAAVVGVVLAWAVGNTLGVDTAGVAVVLLVGLALGSLPWFRGEATTGAATALVVLTTGFAGQDDVLLSRLADTGIGIAVGLTVNFAVWPPLRRRSAIAAMDALDDLIGDLLVDVADGLAAGYSSDDVEEWLERTSKLDDDVDRAWSLVRQASESARLNPRRSAGEFRDPRQWVSLLERTEQALAEARSMVRTLARLLERNVRWRGDFHDAYVETLRESGLAIAAAEPEPIRDCRERLDQIVARVEQEDSTPLWPVYGGLLVNLRNILDAMEEVAAANPLSQPPLPFRRRIHADDH
jgi:uncharacterized membrane protein YccC